MENTALRNQRRLTPNFVWFCTLIILILLAYVTPFGYRVIGRVIDDETGKPVEGAVFAIRWKGCKGMFLGIQIGDGSGCRDIGKDEGVTDAEGIFEVLKYTGSVVPPSPEYEMVIYKDGYVIWCNERIMFPERYEEVMAGRRKREEIWEPGEWKWGKDGMIIRMRPWKKEWKEGYADRIHASTACRRGSNLSSGLLSDAVRRECLLDRYYEKSRGEKYPD